MWNNLLLGGQKMTIRKAEEKDILRIIELLGQVLQIHADMLSVSSDCDNPGLAAQNSTPATQQLSAYESSLFHFYHISCQTD